MEKNISGTGENMCKSSRISRCLHKDGGTVRNGMRRIGRRVLYNFAIN
jgi:predicted transcriptional regulator